MAARRPALTTLMYLVDRPVAIANIKKNWRSISIVAPQSFNMDAQGFIAGEPTAAMVEAARRIERAGAR
jgi:sRNA-binding protein